MTDRLVSLNAVMDIVLLDPGIPTWQFEMLKKLPFVESPLPEQLARDIATIIENEKDMRVILKNSEQVVRCSDCKNWIAGYITDNDDFIPPKCGKYQQMVGHSSDDFCSLAEKKNDE